MFDYLVVGAGLSGLTFARMVKEAGRSVIVIDRRDHIGGNVRTIDIGGIEVHEYGPHIFHTSNQTVWEFVNRFSEFEQYTHSPMAMAEGQIYNLPFNMNLFHRLFGVKTPEEAMEMIKADCVPISNPQNAEEQALSLVGKSIYEKLIKGYTEKQWGKKCTELPASILKRIPLRFDYNNDYFRDRWSAMPKDGYNKLIENLASGIPVMTGIDFNLNREIAQIASKVVYTGPIDELMGRHIGVLEYRSLRFENEILDVENYQGTAVMNYTDIEIPYTRITEHKHFRRDKNQIKHTVITKEYSADYKNGQDGAEPYYPVNNDRNNDLYRRYREMAEKDGFILCGRLGDYKYYNMDAAIQEAMIAAQKELWSV